MKIRILIASIASILTIASCSRYRIEPSGIIVTDTRNITGFRNITVEDGLNVEIVPSDSESVAVEADDNVVPFIETYTTGSNLIIKIKNNTWIKGHPHIKVTVNATELTAVSGSGGSQINSTGIINDEKFLLELSGGSQFSGSLDSDGSKLSLSGGSHASIQGWSFSVHLVCSGGSVIKGNALSTNEVYATLSGGSTTELKVNNTIEVIASGGSIFKYSGNATIVQKSLSGGSEIIKY